MNVAMAVYRELLRLCPKEFRDEFADDIAVTLINDSDAFVFGYAKLHLMFGRPTLEAVRLPYRRPPLFHAV